MLFGEFLLLFVCLFFCLFFCLIFCLFPFVCFRLCFRLLSFLGVGRGWVGGLVRWGGGDFS